MVSRHRIARAARSCGSERSNAPTRRSYANRRRTSSPCPHNISIWRRIARPSSSGASASRWAIAMHLTNSNASGRRSSGSSGISSYSSTSRASRRRAAPFGGSRIGEIAAPFGEAGLRLSGGHEPGSRPESSSIRISSSHSVARRPVNARSRSRSPPIMWRSVCSRAITAHRTLAKISQKRTRRGSIDLPDSLS